MLRTLQGTMHRLRTAIQKAFFKNVQEFLYVKINLKVAMHICLQQLDTSGNRQQLEQTTDLIDGCADHYIGDGT